MKRNCFLMLYVCMAAFIQPEFAHAQPWLTNGLVAYFPFNGNANDESGNGHDGQVDGALLTNGVNGLPDSAYLFSQNPLRKITGSGIDLANSSLTVSFWLKKERRPGEETTQQGWTVTLGSVDGNGKILHFTLLERGETISFDFFNDQLHANSPGVGETNWSHVVGSWDKQTSIRCVYIDGELKATDTSIGFSGTSDFRFQAHDSQVLLDEIRFYKRALSAVEVQALYGSETQPCTPRRARAAAIVENGSVVGATVRDFGCGYTNAPLVLIRGGGGAGAEGYAMIDNGRVTGIVITNAGSGYTSTPRIEIASPPFVPTVGIRVNRVEVVQTVVLGRKYVLESSQDAASWSPALPPFTATSESITNEFDTDLTGRYFRVRETP